MRVWRLITHHDRPEEMLRWSKTMGRVAIGWGDIGDLRTGRFRSPNAIADAIREHYPMLTNAGRGGPSLWDFWVEMARDDLVILSDSHRRGAVMRAVGDYEFVARGDELVGDYQHQREAEEVGIDPDELWARAGGKAPGQSIYRPLIRCRRDVEPGPTPGEAL